MTVELVLAIILAAVVGSLIYTLLGLFPGTDETAVLVPSVAILLALKIEPVVIFSFFISAMISLNVTDSIPTALTGIPGGVMSTPFVSYSKTLKERGLVVSSLKKMTIGSLIGTLVALIVFSIMYLFVYVFKGFHEDIVDFFKSYQGYVFFIGALFLMMMGKNKVRNLIAIVPLLAIFIGVKKWLPAMSNTPYFLSITTGPILLSFLQALMMKKRVNQVPLISLEYPKHHQSVIKKNEIKSSFWSALIASWTFMLSPVAMTSLIGEMSVSKKTNVEEKAFHAVTNMNAIKNATYLSGLLISLFIFKLPISPVAIGPGSLFFSENIMDQVKMGHWVIALLIGVAIALFITVFLSLRYGQKMTKFVFKYISQEAVILMLLSLFILITVIEGGLVAIPLVFGLSLLLGLFNHLGISFGVQFMLLYATILWR